MSYAICLPCRSDHHAECTTVFGRDETPEGELREWEQDCSCQCRTEEWEREEMHAEDNGEDARKYGTEDEDGDIGF